MAVCKIDADLEALERRRDAAIDKVNTTLGVLNKTQKARALQTLSALTSEPSKVSVTKDMKYRLNTDDVKQLDDVLRQMTASEEIMQAKKDLKAEITEFGTSAERAVWKESLLGQGAIHGTARFLSRWNKDLHTWLADTNLLTLEWVGKTLTSSGEGWGGKVFRGMDAAIVNKTVATPLKAFWQLEYNKLISEALRDKGVWTAAKGPTLSSSTNEDVREVHLDIAMYLNKKHLGKSTEGTPREIIKLAEHVEAHRFKVWETAKRYGLTGQRSFPKHQELTWSTLKVHNGDTQVIQDLFTKSYTEAGNSLEEAKVLSAKMMEEILDSERRYKQTFRSSLDQLYNLDLSTENADGLKLSDLLEQDYNSSADILNNNIGGWVGLFTASKGHIRNASDIENLFETMREEAEASGMSEKKLRKTEQLLEDVFDLHFGKPLRKGMSHEVKAFQNLATVNYMTGLGIAKAADTGQVLLRALYRNYNEDYIADVMGMVRGDPSLEHVILDLQELVGLMWGGTKITNVARQTDVEELKHTSKLRNFTRKLADRLTLGEAKAVAMHNLSTLTGNTAIDMFQSRVSLSGTLKGLAALSKGNLKALGSEDRLTDIGVMRNGKVVPEILSVFKDKVKYTSDGRIRDLGLHDWTMKERTVVATVLMRQEAYDVQSTLVGERPVWTHPVFASLITQFKMMPLVAQQKQLLRNLRFADMEAMLSLAIHTATAAVVRAGALKALAAGAVIAGVSNSSTDDTLESWYPEQTHAERYALIYGIMPDVYKTLTDIWSGGLDTSNQWENAVRLTPAAEIVSEMYHTGKLAGKGEFEAAAANASKHAIYGNLEILKWIRKEVAGGKIEQR